ncbi:hypothetical protein [Labedaea rhizosphaerae]|uniref:Transcriptional regulator with AbiEi antitoxin domain of type IV toxin-antitoxin system n=1 Tax=Labedaea rhizosphaerae TaxID=598644 RepID=A0A4R6S8Y1_LABRH|nr:hypothetical protein [Labedaea rhizosphaerae]TDP96241.1 hypothetical protein EV186_104225 [Labedaea rhizosphaerae]
MQALVHLPALSGLFPHRIARVGQLAALGLNAKYGQTLLPGVVMLGKSPPRRTQFLQAALFYAGSHAVVTGMDALHLHGVTAAEPGPIHVLAPSSAGARSNDKVRVTGTTQLPEPVMRKGFPCAPVPRAALDAARVLGTVDRARGLLGMLVRGGHTDIAELRAELGRSRSAGSGVARKALQEMAAGAYTPAEVQARDVVRASGLPAPSWTAALHHTDDGRFLAVVDAWWPKPGLAWEFGESSRHDRDLAAAGVPVVHTPKARLFSEPAAVAAELRHAYKHVSRRGEPCRASS